MPHYFLALDLPGAHAREVTEAQWVQAERNAGFYPKSTRDDRPCTAGFSGHGVVGWILNEEPVDIHLRPEK